VYAALILRHLLIWAAIIFVLWAIIGLLGVLIGAVLYVAIQLFV
jgi:hypothetical protein